MVVLGIAALLFIIWYLVRQANRPQSPTCAGYILIGPVTTEESNANRTAGESPGDIQLSVCT